MFVIKPRGGLCNYLRCVFSCNQYANSVGQKLVVIWEVTKKCNGFFLDYFEPVENIVFIRNNQRNYKIDRETFTEHPDFTPRYDKLNLRPNVKDIINERRNRLGNNYISVHIRRTDHITLALKNNNFTTDEEFIHFIDTNKMGKNLYIAADNKETYDSFRSRYSDLVKFDYHNVIAGPRNTELLDAVIDLFMCVFSEHFMGSGYSSFSGLIVHLRMTLKKDILEPPKLIMEDNTLYNKNPIKIPRIKLPPQKKIKNINKVNKGLYRELNIRFYRNKYPDIKHFTDNQVILHYVNYGKREGRLPSAR